MRTRVAAGVGASLLVAVALFSWWLLRSEAPADAWPIGSITEYPWNTPIAVEIDHGHFDLFATEGEGVAEAPDTPRPVSPTLVWVVNRPGTEPLVLLQRSPWLGCRVRVATAADAVGFGHTPPDGFAVGFLDPCHGGLFDITGEHLGGPGARGLSRFPVGISAEGTILVDLTNLEDR